mmetsp:Transcript_25310/g.67137  ORF Transcript_25310/g.67137 Transcript_25310/m.67137 type:complete len:121 (+) Transcript_25310:1545-1907(+)
MPGGNSRPVGQVPVKRVRKIYLGLKQKTTSSWIFLIDYKCRRQINRSPCLTWFQQDEKRGNHNADLPHNQQTPELPAAGCRLEREIPPWTTSPSSRRPVIEKISMTRSAELRALTGSYCE